MSGTTTGGTNPTGNANTMVFGQMARTAPLLSGDHDLSITVRVVDVRTVRLIPHSILAAEILYNLMMPKASAMSRGMVKQGEHPYARMEYLELTADISHGVLAADGRTEYTGMKLRFEEYEIARAAVKAHRKREARARAKEILPPNPTLVANLKRAARRKGAR